MAGGRKSGVARACVAVGVGLAAVAAGASAARSLAQDDPPMATTMPNPDIIEPLPVMPADGNDTMMMGNDTMMMGADGNATAGMDMSDMMPVTMPNPDIIEPLPVLPATDEEGGAQIVSEGTDEEGNPQITVETGMGEVTLTASETTVTIPGFPAFNIPGFGGLPGFRFPGTPDIQIPAVQIVGNVVPSEDP